jgi:hypothetical protein
VSCRQNTAVFRKWFIEYYTINYMFRPLYVGHPQVFIKLIELLCKQYGVLWGGDVLCSDDIIHCTIQTARVLEASGSFCLHASSVLDYIL